MELDEGYPELSTTRSYMNPKDLQNANRRYRQPWIVSNRIQSVIYLDWWGVDLRSNPLQYAIPK